MSSNQTLMQKADMAISDLATAGALNAEQSAAFVRKLIQQPTLLRNARTVVMGAASREINKIGFADRILMPASSNTPLDADTSATNRRSKPTTEKITLNTKEVIAEIRLPYDVIEDNIERGSLGIAGGNSMPNAASGGLKDTIMQLIAERAALDLEELALLGDTGSGDAYLALLDGYLAQATTTVDAGAAALSKDVFKNVVKTMPDQYLRNRAALKHYVSVDNETEYRSTLAERETNLGDSLISGTAPVYAYGSPVEAVSLMPSANGLFTNPQNLIFGMQRNISVEVDKDISRRVFIIVLTARVDFKVEEPDAIVKITNLG